MESLSSILFVVVLLGMLAIVLAFRLPLILRRRQVREQQWLRARQRCESCGYDVRMTIGNCPECGADTRRIDRTGDASYVQKDIPCRGCGVTLRGRLKMGFCPACGHRVGASQLAHIRRELGCRAQATHVFVGATISAIARLQSTSGKVPAAVAARELCLAVRDEGIKRAGSVEAARAMLIALGLSDSEKIGRFLRQFVDSELLVARKEEDFSEFVGLFDLDSLFAAGNAEAASTSPSVVQDNANENRAAPQTA